jgi:hypothetical protein
MNISFLSPLVNFSSYLKLVRQIGKVPLSYQIVLTGEVPASTSADLESVTFGL